jgi:hypothetical protein
MTLVRPKCKQRRAFIMITWACRRPPVIRFWEFWFHFWSNAGLNFLMRIVEQIQKHLSRIITGDGILTQKGVHAKEYILVHPLPRSFKRICWLRTSWLLCFGIWREFCLWTTCHT